MSAEKRPRILPMSKWALKHPVSAEVVTVYEVRSGYVFFASPNDQRMGCQVSLETDMFYLNYTPVTT